MSRLNPPQPSVATARSPATLTFDAGADFVFSTTTTLDVAGVVTFGGFGIADLVGLDSSVAVGTYTLIDGTGTVDFTNVINVGMANAVSLGGGKSAYLKSGSLEVVVTAIPEPVPPCSVASAC